MSVPTSVGFFVLFSGFVEADGAFVDQELGGAAVGEVDIPVIVVALNGYLAFDGHLPHSGGLVPEHLNGEVIPQIGIFLHGKAGRFHGAGDGAGAGVDKAVPADVEFFGCVLFLGILPGEVGNRQIFRVGFDFGVDFFGGIVVDSDGTGVGISRVQIRFVFLIG